MNRLVLALTLPLAACSIPKTASPPVMRQPGELGLSGPAAPAIDAEWWTAYGDPQLDRIVADALAGNPSLDAALARVRQARAALQTQRADLRPNITGDANAQETRLSNRYIIPPPYGGTWRFVGTATANLNWNIDLFGKQRSAIRAAGETLRAVDLDATAARLALAVSVVQTYLELARAEQQAAIASRTIQTRENNARLIDVRIRNRLASNLDRSAAGTLLAQAREALVGATGSQGLAKNALAALAGHGPDYAAAIVPTALHDDGVIPLPAVIPADLLARRADIAAAEARVAAATQSQEAARRAFYPDINLQALAGSQAIGFGSWFSFSAATAGVGPAIHLPILDGGRLRADHAGATAGRDLAVANYDDEVTGAVREAADALTRIATLDGERTRNREVVQGYAETGRLNRIRVQSGLESRLDLIDNDVRQLDAELTQANLSADAAIARVQLVLALGGGFARPKEQVQ